MIDKPISPDAAAVRYGGDGAPQVIARGRGANGQEIIDIAHAHNIPISEDPALNEVLMAVPVGEEIPEFLYQAVAELLTYVYQLAGKTPAGLEQTRNND